jgi:hypothetical protein
MRRTIIIETLALWCIGVVGTIEASRLILFKNPNVLYDTLGPGWFILLVSVALMIVGVCHFFTNREKSDAKPTGVSEAIIPVLCTILACSGYIFLIGIVGYIVASVIFFFVQFWIFGIRAWKINIGLSLLLTAAYYLLFVEFCSLIFPRGYLSPLFDSLS